MDVVTLQSAKRDTKTRIDSAVSSALAPLRFKLDRGLENASLGVVGDSTGAGKGDTGQPTRWVWWLTESLAALYPGYTVVWNGWNITTNSYDAPVTVQTGTGTGNAGGPFTLTIWNASASGKAPTYSRDSIIFMLPAGSAPDVVFVNHGHNMTVDTGIASIADYYQLVRDILRFGDGRPNLVLIGQNPRIAPAANVTDHIKRMTRIQELAASDNLAFVNITQAFLDQSDYATLINASDGIHPTDAGSQFWASIILNIFKQSIRVAAPRGQGQDDRIFIPASHFMPSLIVGSSPSPAALNSTIPTLAFTKESGPAGASAIVHLPQGWRQVNVWAYWTVSDANAGNVAWRFDNAYIPRVGAGRVSATSTNPISLSAASSVAGAAPGAAYAQSITLILAGAAFTGSRNIICRIVRDSANALDTYAGTANLFALVIERAA